MDKRNKLYLAICFSFTFMILEVIGGLMANSLAILSDAVHLFSDITGFIIALLAVELATLPATAVFTYGHSRAEVIGAFVSVLSLWIATIYLMFSACFRVLFWFAGKGEPVNGKYMFIVACIGLFVNVCLAVIFNQEHHSSSSFSVHGHSCSDESCVRNMSDQVQFVGADADGGVSNEMCGVCAPGHGYPPPSTAKAKRTRRVKKFEGMSYGQVGTESDVDSSLLENGYNDCEGGFDESDEVTVKLLESTAGNDSALNSVLSVAEDAKSAFLNVLNSYTSPGDGNNGTPTSDEDLNMRAVYLHVLTDMAQSAGVAVVGGIIWANPSLSLLDPLSSFLFGGLIIWSTYALMVRIVRILMMGAPSGVDADAIRRGLGEIAGVAMVEQLHIWELAAPIPSSSSSANISEAQMGANSSSNTTQSAETGSILTCHLLVKRDVDTGKILRQALSICQDHSISQPTIQIVVVY